MSDFTVINGTCEYKHAVPKAEYNSVTPMVSLSFTVAEGSDPAAAANRVMAVAQDIVERAIAGKITVEQVSKGRPSVNPPSPARGREDATGPVGTATTLQDDAVTSVELEVVTEGPEAVKARRGRPPVNPTPAAQTNGATENSGTTVDYAGDVEIDDDIGIETEEGTTLTLKDDIQPLAQKVSAHLRKDGGNINALREVIKECGATSLLTIEPAKFPLFIEKAKALLS